jgi:aspartate oxidase
MEFNLDITADMIPIRPAAHYAMGGVRTDFPAHDDAKFLKHSIVKGDSIRFA